MKIRTPTMARFRWALAVLLVSLVWFKKVSIQISPPDPDTMQGQFLVAKASIGIPAC